MLARLWHPEYSGRLFGGPAQLWHPQIYLWVFLLMREQDFPIYFLSARGRSASGGEEKCF
jgi:hypothetical protein